MSEVKVNKLSPRSGTTVTLGDSGDTFSIPSGATLAIAGSVTGFTSAGIDDNATSVAITIDSSERVGIGTTSPEHLLDVISSDSVPARIRSTANSNMALEIDSASNRNANVEFKENDSSKWFVGNEASSDAFRFFSSTANSESMRISSAGLVGIGTSSPSAPLHIDTNTADANNPFINFDNNDGNIGQVRMTSSGDFGFRANTGGTGQMFFQVNGSTEAMRIDSSGDVGIGITSPNLNSFNNAVTLSGTNNAGYELAKGSTLHGAFAVQGDNRVQLINFQNADLTFNTGTSATERMRVVHSTGNVGIGTSTVPAKLTVSDTDSAFIYVEENTGNVGDTSGILFKTSASNPGFFKTGMILEDDGTTFARGKLHIVQNSTANDSNATVSDSVVTILNDGKIGIGTTSPSARVNILESTVGTDPTADSSNFIKLTNNDIGTVNEVFGIGFSSLSGNTDYLGAFVQAEGNYTSNFNHSLIFGTRGTSGNATERMRITSSGKIGINTSSPDDNLHIKGNVFIEDSSPEITFETTSSSKHNWQIAVQENVDQALEISVGGTDADASNDTFSPVAVFKNSGNVGIGTSSPRAKLDLGSGSGDSSTISTTPSDYQLILEAPQGTGDYGRNIGWSVGTNGVFASINAVDTGTSDKTGLAFITGDNSSVAEAVRISHDGVVGIGTTSPSSSYRLSAVGGTGAVVGAFIETTSTDSGHEASIIKRPNSGVLVQFLGSGQVGSITTNGSTTTYGTSSDYRLKENVVDLNNATERLKQLQPKRFNFISDADTTLDGFIAHEVSSVVPEAIHGTKDDVDADGNPKYQNIDQSKLVPLLVKTIQELEARITTLEANNP